MNEWNDPSAALPVEGQHVEVRLVSGQRIKSVEFALGRFWKVRKGAGGHAYSVAAWRSIEAPKRGRVIAANAADNIKASNGSPESSD